jgi:hypothetical protein
MFIAISQPGAPQSREAADCEVAMKKPAPNKIAPSFDNRAVDPVKVRRSFNAVGANRADRTVDRRLKPPAVAYKRCKQAIVELMAARLAEDDMDEPTAAVMPSDDAIGIHNSQPPPSQEQLQQQQQTEDTAGPDDRLRDPLLSLSTLRWAALKQKKALDS